MAAGKKRPLAHIKGVTGVEIFKKYLPAAWVVREYTPDYGIDLSVELFAQYGDGFITNGEHIFFQVKGTEQVVKTKLKVYDRNNVEKGYFENSKQSSEIEVVKFVLDTDLLATVEKMGSAVPVILVVVDINTKDVFFICLNDYIEKILIPEDTEYTMHKTKTIYIPTQNQINSDGGIETIEWYAKRPKLYALFNKINYQTRELQYILGGELEARIRHFLKIIMRSDAWSAESYFGAMCIVKQEIDYFMEHGITEDAVHIIQSMVDRGENVDEEIWEATHCEGFVSFREAQKTQEIHRLWDKLGLMGDTFEDITKEAFLPTSLGIVISKL